MTSTPSPTATATAAPIGPPTPTVTPTPTTTPTVTTTPTTTATVTPTTPTTPTDTPTATATTPPEGTATTAPAPPADAGTPSPTPGHAPIKPAVAAYPSAVEADNPVAWWRLGDERGRTAEDTVIDHPGAYRKGVRLGQPGLLAGDPLDPAAAFDGADDQVKVANSRALDLPNFSLEAWIRPSRMPARGRSATIVSRAGAYVLRLDGSLITFAVGTGRPLRAKSVPLTIRRTVHLVSSYDGARMRIFLNGRLVATRELAHAAVATHAPLMIGSAARGDAFAGTIDDVAVYDRALPAARVMAHYSAGSSIAQR
ncbi:MAG: hypothetical protein QOF76_3322 [Solirubrobacteraceae bacterium]|nr:hypothetical protein [Solirubrobacteraceae bacterium]